MGGLAELIAGLAGFRGGLCWGLAERTQQTKAVRGIQAAAGSGGGRGWWRIRESLEAAARNVGEWVCAGEQQRVGRWAAADLFGAVIVCSQCLAVLMQSSQQRLWVDVRAARMRRPGRKWASESPGTLSPGTLVVGSEPHAAPGRVFHRAHLLLGRAPYPEQPAWPLAHPRTAAAACAARRPLLLLDPAAACCVLLRASFPPAHLSSLVLPALRRAAPKPHLEKPWDKPPFLPARQAPRSRNRPWRGHLAGLKNMT